MLTIRLLRPHRPGRKGVQGLERFRSSTPRQDGRPPRNPRPGDGGEPRRQGEQGGVEEEVRGAEQEVDEP